MQAYGIGAQYNYKTYSRSLSTNRTPEPQGQQRSFTDTLEITGRRHRNPIAMLENVSEDIQEIWEITEEELINEPAQDDDAPLTERELALAKAHEIYSALNDAFLRLFIAESGTNEEEKAAALEEFREARDRRIENRELFDNGDYWYAFSGIIVMHEPAQVQWQYGDPINLPHQGFSYDAASNAITLGIGSKIPIDNYYMVIGQYSVGAEQNGKTYMSPYGYILLGLITAVNSGDERWGNGPGGTYETLAFLQKLGVDTSRDFKINNTEFEVIGGVLQTKDYVEPEIPPVLGKAGLDELLRRAYAQNLM